jgi:hypothetical protein
MAYTLNQTILWSQSQMGTYIPLTAQTGNEPATTIANMVVAFMLNPPFTWPTNRAEDTSLVMVAGTQDYTLSITNFGFLETVTLKDPVTNKYAQVPKIYNSSILGLSNEQQARPNACSVKLYTPGTNVSLRFLSAPEKAYTGTSTYQKAPVLFSATTQDWFTQCNIPGNQIHIYNNLFLGECFQVDGDEQSAAIYRRRGMAALLATADGLTEMQKSMIFAQAMFSDIQAITAQLRAQSASQARAV